MNKSVHKNELMEDDDCSRNCSREYSREIFRRRQLRSTNYCFGGNNVSKIKNKYNATLFNKNNMNHSDMKFKIYSNKL